ncbi:hypothetical protein WISP_122309 [Willisornis vidua]|uniref:Uncharacterized protein n=1 Tax=Willisornis vidua TaxID=1566151 RepID=A0ABQ9CX73_9PASS|nr:hypothetical protein WISP_122309 [Willisornis vidua]
MSCWSESKDDQRSGTPSHEDKLSEMALFTLEKRKLQGDLIVFFQYMEGAYRVLGGGILTRECSDRTRGNSFKLKESRFRLDIKKKFFTLRVLRHWHMLPRELVDASAASALEVSKDRSDGTLSNLD